MTRKKDTGEAYDNGGQFAAVKLDEPTFHSLTNEDISNLMTIAVNHAKRRFVATGRPDPHAAQDIAQGAILQFLDQVEKRPALANENPKGYITTTVTHMVSAETSPVSKAARSGFVVLSKEISEQTQMLGRDLTREEYEALGEKILREWPSDRPKPPKDFYKATVNRQVLPTDFTEYESASLVPAFGEHSYTSSPDDSGVAMGNWSKALVESAGNATATTLIKYNAFAEHYGVSPVVPASITRRTEVVTRTAMNQHICEFGGFDDIKEATDADKSEAIAAVLTEVAAGRGHAAADTVFTPWNRASNPEIDRRSIKSDRLGDEERREVAKALLKHPEQAYPLWRSALLMADKTNYDRVLAVFDKPRQNAS